MNIYAVYTDSSSRETPPTLIKQEFSVIAGFFTALWALYHKMWSIALLAFSVAFILSFFDISSIAFAINIVTFLFFGCFASQIREYYAQNKYGMIFSDIILAHDLEEAELKYYIRTSNN